MESRAEEQEIASLQLVKQIAKMFKEGEDNEGRPFNPETADWQLTLESLIDSAREILA